LNILFVADVSMADVIGGAERVLYEQSTRLVKKGHAIHILTRKLPNHEKYQEVIQGVNEWRYDCNQSNPGSFIKTNWSNAKRLFECLQQKYHFDCINYHHPFSALGVNHSKMSTRVPKIYICHSLSFEEFLSRSARQSGILHSALNYFQLFARMKIEKNGLYKSDKRYEDKT